MEYILFDFDACSGPGARFISDTTRGSKGMEARLWPVGNVNSIDLNITRVYREGGIDEGAPKG